MVLRVVLLCALLLPLAACDASGPPASGAAAPSGDAGAPTAASGFDVDASLFGPLGDEAPEDATGESLMVVGGEQAKVVAALQAAGRRWLYVTEDGEDLSRPTPDPLVLAEADMAGRYTPNFVFDVYLAARGPALMVDCKGAVPPAMGQAFVDIVVEELRRVGVTGVTFADAGVFTGEEKTLGPIF